MVGRYVRILEIYKEYKEEDKMKQYLKAYLEVKSILSEMEFYLSIDFEDNEENDVIIELTKELKFFVKLITFHFNSFFLESLLKKTLKCSKL
jgi:hypothetical protein